MILVDDHGQLAVFETSPDGAAHSMDTDWYGIDAAGNVAVLHSGEEGSIPWTAHRQYWGELYEDLVAAHIVARMPADPYADPVALRRALEVASDPAEQKILRAILDGDDASREIYGDYLEHIVRDPLVAIEPLKLPHEWNGILRFASREYMELFHTEYHYDNWRVLDRVGMHLAAAENIQEWAFLDYWGQEAITAAFLIEQTIEPSALGIYEYRCPFSGEYRRDAVPAHPALVGDLPPALRAIFETLRIPVRFATAEGIYPDSMLDCQTYRMD